MRNIEKLGWIIECESPLEIRNEETGDFASGYAARILIDELKSELHEESTNKKIRVFVDMDGVLCDFDNAHKEAIEKNPNIRYPQSQYGFFANLKPIPRAIEYYKLIRDVNNYDMRILTSPSVLNPMSYTEKRVWVEKYLGIEEAKKMILAPDKSLLIGDFLIDDYNYHKESKQHEFQGELIWFGSKEFEDWVAVGNYFNKIK